MEAMEERRIWQRVRGTGDQEGPDRVQRLREVLAAQGELLGVYRQLGRRGGRCRQLCEQKQCQIDCLRGLLRVLTGQCVAPPKAPCGPVDLLRCHQRELQFLQELAELRREPDLGPVFETLHDRQRVQCRVLLEVLGTA